MIKMYYNPGKKLYWLRDYELDISYNTEYIQSDQLSGALLYQIISYNLRWVTTGILKKRPERLHEPIRELEQPLRITILAGNKDIVQDLLDRGANIHQKWPTDDLPMVTPFWKPSGQYYNPERNPLDDPYDMLLKYKPNPESMPPLAEDTAFEYPCHIVSQYAPEILPHFLKNGAYANIRAGDGSTPILLRSIEYE